MSYASLLIDQVTILNEAESEETDRYGNDVVSDDDGTLYPARVVQMAASEVDDLTRDTRTTTYEVYLPKTADVSALSKIVWESETYRVVGDPNRVPGRSGLHHIELRMEKVTA